MINQLETDQQLREELEKVILDYAFEEDSKYRSYSKNYAKKLASQLLPLIHAKQEATVREFAEKVRMKIYEDEDSLAKLAMPEEDVRIYRKMANALVERLNRVLAELNQGKV